MQNDKYIALSSETPLVRYAEAPQPVQVLTVVPPLHILGMAVDPDGRLDLTKEKSGVRTALDQLVSAGLVEMTWVEGGKSEDLQRSLRKGPWHIFHFVGHGTYEEEFDESYLVFEGENGGKVALTADKLGRLLATHKPLRLAFLNSCYGASAGPENLYTSAAATLIQRGVPAVIAMQFEINDAAATIFARVFYEALADGLVLEAALTEARIALSLSFPLSMDWVAPVAFLRARDGVLFSLDKSSADGKPQTEVGQMSGLSHLTGEQYERLQNALEDAFDRGSLARMVEFKLGKKLDVIAGGSNQSDIVYNLIWWAQRSGRLSDLVNGSLSAEPDNPLLRSFADSVR